LGAIFAGIALISDSTWALAAGTVRNWLGRSQRRLELIGGIGGLAMIGIGARLALTGRNN
ncbi:MAG: LysE family translocator, partial [Trebonia sp.]